MARKAKHFVYAVRRGHKPGIYRNWEECQAQVEGYSNSEYKRFPTLEDARKYLDGFAATKALPASQPEQLKIDTAVAIPQFLPGSQPSNSTMKKIVIYADGACIGNPGPGGYGVVIIYGERRKELSAGFRLTTNNRMEILGCIAGLMALKEPCDVTIYSDSRYVVNTMTKSWAVRWRKNGWKRKDKNGEEKEALNQDLWLQMLELCDEHRVEFKWIRGHQGIEENERCDQLARDAATSHPLDIDSVYETSRKPLFARAGMR